MTATGAWRSGAGWSPGTHPGRAALEALGITPIFALSPPGPRPIERLTTPQDRLAASLRLAGITEIPAANEFCLAFSRLTTTAFAQFPAR
jgi:hypothetical protein